LGPEGLTFAKPVTITLPATSAADGAYTRSKGGPWTQIPEAHYDPVRHQIVASLHHFSDVTSTQNAPQDSTCTDTDPPPQIPDDAVWTAPHVLPPLPAPMQLFPAALPTASLGEAFANAAQLPGRPLFAPLSTQPPTTASIVQAFDKGEADIVAPNLAVA